MRATRVAWLIVSISLLTCSASAQGARFPNLRFVEPDPSSGRPVLVHTSCGSPEDPGYMEGETWGAAISVYAYSNVEMFVDEPCILASAWGFDSSGKYAVEIYSFYQKDAFCHLFAPVYSPESHPNPGFLRECHGVIYKSRRISVDTRSKAMMFTNTRLEDSDGRDLGPVHDDKGWQPIGDFAVCVDKITELVKQKAEYLKRREGRK
jgi:hypothetical protein